MYVWTLSPTSTHMIPTSLTLCSFWERGSNLSHSHLSRVALWMLPSNFVFIFSTRVFGFLDGVFWVFCFSTFFLNVCTKIFQKKLHNKHNSFCIRERYGFASPSCERLGFASVSRLCLSINKKKLIFHSVRGTAVPLGNKKKRIFFLLREALVYFPEKHGFASALGLSETKKRVFIIFSFH